jgi:hypothetical protein
VTGVPRIHESLTSTFGFNLRVTTNGNLIPIKAAPGIESPPAAGELRQGGHSRNGAIRIKTDHAIPGIVD